MRTQPRPQLAAGDRVVGTRSQLQQMRRDGQVPASLYGGATLPITVMVDRRALDAYLLHYGTGAILELGVAGAREPVIVKEIHRKPTTDAVLHVAFQRVVMADELKTSVPLYYLGIEKLRQHGLVLQIALDTLELHGRADEIPDSLTVDVGDMRSGDVLHVGAIPLPAGIHLQRDPGMTAASIGSPRGTESAEEPAADEAA